MTTTEATHDTERRPLLGKTQSTYTDGPVTQPTAEEYSTDQGQSKDPLDEATRLAALKALPWYRRPSITWILPFIFLLSIVMGISQAPQEQLIIRVVCKDHFKDNDFPSMVQNAASPSGGSCNTPEIQALAALTMGRIRSLKYLFAIFTIGYFTSLSDRFGRKPLIFLTLIPVMFTQILIVYMARPTVNLGMWILYLDALFVGALGGGVLLGPSLNSYVVDCTPREGRSLVMGYVMVSLSLGQIFGPILGGFLIGLTGDVTSAMTVSIIIQSVLILYAIILPESLQKYNKPNVVSNLDTAAGYSKAEETSFLIKIKNNILVALDPLLLFLPGKMDTSEDVNVSPSKYTLVTLIVAYGLLQFATTGAEVVLIPYTNLAFQWAAVEDGIYLTVQGAASFIVYVLVFPVLQKLYKRYIEKESPKSSDLSAAATLSSSEIDQHVRDARDAELEATEEAILSIKPIEEEVRKKTVWNDLSFFIFGCFIYLISYLLVPLFRMEAVMFLSCCVRALASVSIPTFYSLVTSFVPIYQTGKALGGVCVLDTIIMSVSSFLYGWIFSKTSSTIPSAAYLVCAAFSLLAILTSLTIWSAFRRAEARK
ncbi:hypothetical protein BGX21_010813 [Mortierella sp. AD011]|nr:hypothetical protein BGX20_005959 [Mortierella sp. AD010]KAF9402227.1 hypothetical protein BGX21_010813 [Mortierella sp. AD011]